MIELNLKVSVSDGDLIILGLQELPYKYSSKLIDNLRMQAKEQIEKQKEILK